MYSSHGPTISLSSSKACSMALIVPARAPPPTNRWPMPRSQRVLANCSRTLALSSFLHSTDIYGSHMPLDIKSFHNFCFRIVPLISVQTVFSTPATNSRSDIYSYIGMLSLILMVRLGRKIPSGSHIHRMLVGAVIVFPLRNGLTQWFIEGLLSLLPSRFRYGS